jgi:formylmethanofuran dehydrogenase subunit E
MSFAKHGLSLPNSTKNNGLKKVCSKCEQERIPEGGIEMAGKWICAACWIKRKIKR